MKKHTRSSRSRSRSPGEAGSVLVLALLITLVILGVGLTAMFLSSSGMKVSGNISRRQEALSATEAGLERAMALVKTVADWDTLLDGSLCSGGTHDPPAGTPDSNTHKGYVLCDPNNGGLPLQDLSVYEASSTVTSAVPDLKNVRYTVYVRNDNAEVRIHQANHNPNAWTDDEDMRILLRVEGWARDSLSFFAVEVVMTVPELGGIQNPCPYGQAGGCDGANTNAMKAAIAKPSP